MNDFLSAKKFHNGFGEEHLALLNAGCCKLQIAEIERFVDMKKSYKRAQCDFI
jgi:hypothetical protein